MLEASGTLGSGPPGLWFSSRIFISWIFIFRIFIPRIFILQFFIPRFFIPNFSSPDFSSSDFSSPDYHDSTWSSWTTITRFVSLMYYETETNNRKWDHKMFLNFMNSIISISWVCSIVIRTRIKCILVPGRTFEAAAILVYQSDLGSILTLRLIKSPSVQSPFEFFF